MLVVHRPVVHPGGVLRSLLPGQPASGTHDVSDDHGATGPALHQVNYGTVESPRPQRTPESDYQRAVIQPKGTTGLLALTHQGSDLRPDRIAGEFGAGQVGVGEGDRTGSCESPKQAVRRSGYRVLFGDH